MNDIASETAVARLVMKSGNAVSPAEIAQILTSYDYTQNNADPERWDLKWTSEVDADAYIRVHAGGEIIDLYTESPENMLNVNYIAMRLGWHDCEMHATNAKVMQMLEVRLQSVNVVNQPGTDKGQANAVQLPVAKPVAATPAAMPAEVPADAHQVAESSLNEEFRTIQDLTIRLGESEAKNAELEEANHVLLRKLKALEATAPAAGHNVAHGDSMGRLLPIIEKHLLSMLDLSSLNESPIVKDLEAAGLKVSVKLASAA